MTRDEVRGQIQEMLGHRDDLVTNIERALRFIQQELESEAELPWFLRKESDILLTIAATATIAKPADFIREWDEDPLSILVTTQYVGLVKDSPNYLRRVYADSTRPMGYSEVGDNFIIYPTPAAVWSVRMVYYAHDAVLSSDIENLWLKYIPGLFIGRAGFMVASGARDKGAQEVFGAMAKVGTEKLFSMTTAKDEAGKRRVMGGED